MPSVDAYSFSLNDIEPAYVYWKKEVTLNASFNV